MSAVRRSFAGLFFGMAFTCACLAISGFVLQRTAFSPVEHRGVAPSVVLGDSELEHELVTLIADGSGTDDAAVTRRDRRPTSEAVVRITCVRTDEGPS